MYTSKTLSTVSLSNYLLKLTEKIELVIKRMRWKAVSLREKCPNPEFFQVRIRENTKQKKFRIWTFSHIVHFNDGKERRNQTEWYGLR